MPSDLLLRPVLRQVRRAWCVMASAALLAMLLPGAVAPAGASQAGALVRIPAGPVILGSDDRGKGYGYAIGSAAAWRWRWFDGEVRRTVHLPAYDIDATPVTQRAYAAFVRASGHRVPHISAADYQAQGFLVHPYAAVRPYLWRDGAPPPERLQHPVVLVSREDGAAYCAWRGGQRGRTCRLPSEDEWEKAARGSDGRRFPWGDRWDPERLNTQARGPYGTTPVQAYPSGRSPYGVWDLAGNVFEWTATVAGAGKGILKGCSWDDAPGICRAAARHARPATSRHILIGFRCLCEVAGGS